MARYPLDTNKNTFMSFDSPFEDAVILTKIEGDEGISTLFDFQVELCSLKSDLSFKDILGSSCTISITNDHGTRFINGIVSEFHQGATELYNTKDEQSFYYARVVPLLWELTTSEDCCIFQEKSALDIIKVVLKKYAVAIDDKVSSAGKKEMDFCVQYNESDFSFVSRLMESAGIFYFFKHEKGKHIMCLCDGNPSFEAMENADQFFVDAAESDASMYGITSCRLKQKIVPAGFAVKDYNFETPDTNLFANTEGSGLGGVKYFYPGRYWNATQETGEGISKTWLESAEAPGLRIDGAGTVPFMTQGYSFVMKNCPRAALNGVKFVAHTIHHFAEIKPNLRDTDLFDPDQTYGVLYKNSFSAFAKEIIYRAPRVTPWPKLTTQTGVVTGKADEEIWTDKYGRIKVKFHWDTSDTKDDKTSCWIRVMHTWAGAGWGSLFIPRIGQEVVVQFLDGDPSNPIVTGSVYNNTHMPPYLPDSPTMSTIKSNTTKGGDGFNELRFNDDKGKEQVYIHAQTDMDTEVEKNQTLTIVEGDRTITLKKGNYERTLEEGNETITLKKGNYAETLEEGDYSLTLKKGKRDISVTGGDETHTNKQKFTQKVTKDYELDVQGNYTCKVKGNATTEVQGNNTLKVTGNNTMTITGNLQMTVTGSVIIKGTAGITAKSSAAVMIDGSASATLNSSAATTVSGGSAVTISGGSACTITGGVVSING